MSHLDQPLERFDLARVLSDAIEIAKLGLKPLVAIFCADALIELIITSIADFGPTGAFASLAEIIVLLCVYCLATGAATRVLHNVGYGHTPDARGAIAEALGKRTPLCLAGLGSIFGAAFAAVFLIVPGLWLAGVWAVIFPVLMFENAGLGAFRRSAELTRGYRWQAAFVILLVLIPTFAATYILTLVVTALPTTSGVIFGSSVVEFALAPLVNICSNCALVAVSVSTYKRLIDLKETGDSGGIAGVFG